MPDTPVTSGSEIISNPGNAALGYSSGVAYNGNNADTNPLGQVDNTLNKLQDEEAQFQVLKYHRRLEEQDKLAAQLAQTGGSLFNVAGPGGQNLSFTALPDDKKVLEQKADEYRKAVIANPNGYKYDDGILKMGQELSALKNHASERARFAATTRVEAAGTNDQEDRQGMIDNLNQEVYGHKLTDFVTPSPYLNKPSWTDETFHPKDVFNKDKMATLDTTTKTDDKGNEIEVNKMGYPIDKLDIRSNITPGNQKVWSEANNMLGRFTGSKYVKDPNFYIEQNAAIDRFNQERGLVDANGQPVNQHAIPHIADVKPDGTIVPNKNLSLQDFVYAMTTPSHGAVTQETKLKKDASELQKEGEGIKKTEADIKNQKQERAHAQAELAEKIREFDLSQKEKAREFDDKNKDDPENLLGQQATKNVLGIMSAVNGDKQWSVIKPIEQSNSDLFKAIKDEAGFKAEGFKEMRMPITTTTTMMGGEPNVTTTASGEKNINGSAKPDNIYYLKSPSGNLHDDRMVYEYKEPGKSGDTRYKVVLPKDGIGNLILAPNNYKEDKKGAQIRAQKYYEDTYLSGQQPAQAATPPASTSTFKSDPTKEAPASVLKLGTPEKAQVHNGTPIWKVNGHWVKEDGQLYKPQ